MAEQLFKKEKDLKAYPDYQEFIEDSLKPLGFGTNMDNTFFDIKQRLFYSLYQETLNNGPSFDAEIVADSIINDLKETFDAVIPSLLQLQRDLHG